MGKIKQVIMGDIEAEELARKKAEAKREQKRLEKERTKVEKEATKVKEESKTEISEEQPAPEPEKEKAVKKVRKLDQRYIFSRGKAYTTAKSLVDPKKLYSITEAIELVKKTSYSKFDGSVEAKLNVSDKSLRGTVTFPHSTGRQIRVAVASDSLIKSLESGSKIDFDVLVTSPDMMPKLARIAKILGPKGLMPNPKTNTINDNPEKLVETFSSSLAWKTQPDFPIIHAVIGKVSFEEKKLAENLAALTKSVGKDKIVSIFIKPTMGPSIKINL